MNCYTWMCIFAVVAVQYTTGSSEVALKDLPPTDELKLNNFTSNCSRAGLFCKSCTELMMCVETEYGWTEQLIENCPGSYVTCKDDKCTSDRNLHCDGTADIPFKCHVPGAFPDPFDCQAYHLCVLTTEQQGDDIVEVVKDFKHRCPNDGNQRYRYDPKSTFCKYEIYNKCSGYPVPICKSAGDSGALIENKSIYYVCERIGNSLYPNLFSCPHGRIYNNYFKYCESGSTTESPPESSSSTEDYTRTTPEDYTRTTTEDYTRTTTEDYTRTTPEDYTRTTTEDYTRTTPEDYTPSYPWTSPSYTEGTTRYPEYTTRYPEYTTGYPEYTTRYPEYTTGYPEYPTDDPGYTSTYRYERK